MSQFLPPHGLRFLSRDEITALKLENQHDDYPLAAESLVIDSTMYSPTQQSVIPESAPQRKLPI